MKKKKFNINFFNIVMAITFGVIGIVFLIISIGFIIYSNDVMKNYYVTEALVVNVVDDYDAGDIYISYYLEVKNEIYSSEHYHLNYYSSNIDLNDILKIYINPKTGEVVYLDNVLNYVFLAVSLSMITVSSVFIVIIFKNKKSKEYYMKYGIKIYAKIINYEIVKHINYGNQNPYKIKSEYEDIFGNKTQFISKPELLEEFKFEEEKYVAVYVKDKKHMDKYYVDLEDIKDKSKLIIY